jgi:hypothetical protein
MYVCMYVRMYVCMHVLVYNMYVCIFEVNLREFERNACIYAWQKVAKWQLGRELLHQARIRAQVRDDKL